MVRPITIGRTRVSVSPLPPVGSFGDESATTGRARSVARQPHLVGMRPIPARALHFFPGKQARRGSRGCAGRGSIFSRKSRKLAQLTRSTFVACQYGRWPARCSSCRSGAALGGSRGRQPTPAHRQPTPEHQVRRLTERLAQYKPEIRHEATRPDSDAARPSDYGLDGESKRRQRRQRHRQKKSPGRRPTEVQFNDAHRYDEVYPDGVRPGAGTLVGRAVWRLEDGRGVLVGYRIFAGPDGKDASPASRRAVNMASRSW